MTFIVIFNVIFYLLLICWTYKNMYGIETKPKAIYIVSLILFVYIITKIIYNIGGNPISKELGNAASTFNKTMVSIFTGVNGIIIIPFIGSLLNKYKEKIIDDEQFKKRIIIIAIIFIIFLIFEFNYMKDVQFNMLQIINR